MTAYVFPIATALTAAVLGLLQAGLTLYVAAGRGQHKTGLGDGGHEALTRRIRMHGNLAENAALFIALLALVELSGATGFARIAGAVFVAARLAHAYGLSMTFGPGANPFRFAGAVGTILCIACVSIRLAIAAL
jgi:uncharacterized membrane protein YecN with MAPEG domain